jgi:hypothetical protein
MLLISSTLKGYKDKFKIHPVTSNSHKIHPVTSDSHKMHPVTSDLHKIQLRIFTSEQDIKLFTKELPNLHQMTKQ